MTNISVTQVYIGCIDRSEASQNHSSSIEYKKDCRVMHTRDWDKVESRTTVQLEASCCLGEVGWLVNKSYV